MTGTLRALRDLIKDLPRVVAGWFVEACNGFVRRAHRPILIEGIDGGSDAFVCPRCSTEWPCKPVLETTEEQS